MAQTPARKLWKAKFPQINGQLLVLPPNKLTEALELMWQDQIEPEEVDHYIVADWN